MSQILAASARPRKPSTSKVSLLGDAQLVGDLAPQRARHLLFDLEPDHLAAPALAQRRFELDHQIRGLVVDFDFAVADDAEGAGAGHLVARETSGGRTG